MPLTALASDLLTAAVAVREHPRSNPSVCKQAARRLSKALAAADSDARDILARVVRLPADRVDEWLTDTIDLLEISDGTEQRRLAAAQRMEAIAWAWGSELPPQPPAVIEEMRAAWAAARELP